MGIKSFINNEVNCELYIGKNAGKRIKNKIENAQRSVKILSPYISPNLVDILSQKQKKGVYVELISSFDQIKKLYNPQNSLLLKKLIYQHRIIDEDSKVKRHKLDLFGLYLLFIFITYMIITAMLISTKKSNLFLSTWYIYAILLIAIINIRYKVKHMKIYDYNYSTPFFVKFTDDPNINLHSKLYIIDNSVAFIGSLNFTSSGLFHNIESCITINDGNVIKELTEYLNFIANYPCREVNLTVYGPEIYKEPIN